jgi:hypothetical protein
LLRTFDGEVTDEILAELWELRLLGVEDFGICCFPFLAAAFWRE